MHLKGFIKRVVTLVGGTAGAQAIAAAISPVLTRLYSPEAFGALGVYSAYLSVLLVVCSLRYELAVPIAPDHKTATSLLVLSGFIVCGASVIITLSGYVLDLFFSVKLFPQSNRMFLAMLFVGLVGGGLYQSLSSFCIRQKEFGVLARTRILQSAGMAAVQTGFGFLAGGPVGLVVGDLTSRVIGVGTVSKRLHVLRLIHNSLKDLLRVAKEFREFPIVMSWAAIFNVLANQAPLLFMPRLFGLGKLGEYFLTTRIMTIPIGMISATVAQVFFAEAARSADKAQLKKLTLGVTMMIAAIGLPIYAVIGTLGPVLFSFVFGGVWAQSGVYAQLLAPMVFLRLLGSSLSSLLMIGGRYREAVLFTALELLLTMGAIWLGAWTNSIEWFVVSFAAISIPLQVASLWRFARVADIGLVELFLRSILPIAICNLPFVVLLVVLNLVGSSTLSLVGASILMVGVFVATLRLQGIKDLMTWA
jgi:O-antigen/teichoic acid export membrane protein